jgi:hypothetical protein
MCFYITYMSYMIFRSVPNQWPIGSISYTEHDVPIDILHLKKKLRRGFINWYTKLWYIFDRIMCVQRMHSTCWWCYIFELPLCYYHRNHIRRKWREVWVGCVCFELSMFQFGKEWLSRLFFLFVYRTKWHKGLLWYRIGYELEWWGDLCGRVEEGMWPNSLMCCLLFLFTLLFLLVLLFFYWLLHF